MRNLPDATEPIYQSSEIYMAINKLDDPINFKYIFDTDEHQIEFIDLHEIGQGGPEIGHIKIDNKIIEKLYFGGPTIHFMNYLFLPMYAPRLLFGARFKLVKIDMNNHELTIVSNTKYQLISLYEVNQNEVVFYTDLEKTQKVEIKF